MNNSITSLDDLLNSCYDEDAKKYIGEAIASYQVGAFRASIVSTWIAVVYDALNKIRKLEIKDDLQAKAFILDFNKARAARDFNKLLGIERNITDTIKSFAFVNDETYLDLCRLKEDRNRCAHPSMQSEDEIYAPSAELARYHIHSAVNGLLRWPPANGRSVVQSLINVVRGQHFPRDKSEAATRLRATSLLNARESAVRNFGIMLTKHILLEEIDEADLKKHYAALLGAHDIHPIVISSVIKQVSNDVFDRIKEENYSRILPFIKDIPDIWSSLEEGHRNVLKSYVKTQLPLGDAELFMTALTIRPLKNIAKSRIRLVDLGSIIQVVSNNNIDDGTKNIYFNEFIRRFTVSTSYSDTGFYIRTFSEDIINLLDCDQIVKIVEACIINSQIYGYMSATDFLEKIFAHSDVCAEETRPVYEKLLEVIRTRGRHPRLESGIVARYPDLALSATPGDEETATPGDEETATPGDEETATPL